MWLGSTGSWQPPLPLHEFLPAQPWSPDLQPPWHLQAFWPLQACFSYVWAGSQPPFPLHEFLPAQPLSLDLQPPLPLHSFWPLQECFGQPLYPSPARTVWLPAIIPAAAATISLLKSRRFLSIVIEPPTIVMCVLRSKARFLYTETVDQLGQLYRNVANGVNNNRLACPPDLAIAPPSGLPGPHQGCSPLPCTCLQGVPCPPATRARAQHPVLRPCAPLPTSHFLPLRPAPTPR